MKPDRSNYEIWLTDWLDGNLTGQQTEELMAFLDENPDIREEADSLSLTRLTLSNISYSGKEHLKKSAADLLPSQIEYLSAGFLEKDLSPDQEKELKQSIEMNQQNRLVFDAIQKTKLSPPQVHFRNKNKLKRLTTGEKIIRYSVIGLSAAAAILFIVFNYLLTSRYSGEIPEHSAAGIFVDTIFTRPPISGINKNYIASAEKANKIHKLKNVVKPVPEILDNIEFDQPVAIAQPDSLSLLKRFPVPEPVSISILQELKLSGEIRSSDLIASTANFTIPLYDDERSGLRKLIAKTFREKLLKENHSNDSPLKPYEIAQAGIDGLNKLLGWQMALIKTNDEKGTLKSLYFSSGILKFNAPVKKTTEVR